MKISRTIRAAAVALRRNRTRSALTILGIIIGVTSIILVVSVGEGAQSLILGEVEGFGTRTIFVEPGREPSGPSDFTQVFSDSLKVRELEALRKKANVPDVEAAEPLVNAPAVASYENETKNLSVSGLSPLQGKILDLTPAVGRFIEEEDVKSYGRVAVLGSEVKEELFGLSDAVGRTVKVKGQNFRVVGVLESKGTSLFLDTDNQIVVPYTAAQRYLTGTDHFNAIVVQATSEEAVPRVARDVERTLRELHNITDPEKDDFHVSTQEDAAQTV
jgi:putative ABC transport system permease protein